MLIYDPVSNFLSGLIARQHQYKCIVDGRDEFRGERLPVGTEEEILAWIKARYKIRGELWLFDMSYIGDMNYIPSRQGWIFYCSSPWFGYAKWNPPHVIKRYLVEVAEAEKVFVLRPFPYGLLDWRVKGALEWNDANE